MQQIEPINYKLHSNKCASQFLCHHSPTETACVLCTHQPVRDLFMDCAQARVNPLSKMFSDFSPCVLSNLFLIKKRPKEISALKVKNCLYAKQRRSIYNSN